MIREREPMDEKTSNAIDQKTRTMKNDQKGYPEESRREIAKEKELGVNLRG